MRVGTCFDFFRGEVGSKYCPDILDDGDMRVEGLRSIKSFLDMSLAEAMTRERWGASKFPRHQLRVASDNKFTPPEKGPKGPMTAAAFMDLIRPAWPPRITPADEEAIVTSLTNIHVFFCYRCPVVFRITVFSSVFFCLDLVTR